MDVDGDLCLGKQKIHIGEPYGTLLPLQQNGWVLEQDDWITTQVAKLATTSTLITLEMFRCFFPH